MANDDILISISEEPDATLRILGEYIGSAYSPQVEVTETQTGHDVAITYDDADEGITTTTFSVEDGEDGADGFSPTLSSSAVTGGHRVSMTDATGTKTFDVMNGLDGADGYSPSAKVIQGDGSATISITDKDGTTTATIHDGADGATGPEGPAGYSPSARVTQSASGATITVTDQSGTTTADISNGAPGEPGQTGPIGPTGEDGFSPTVDVQPITGGHEVTITDADGPHSFDVMDGDPAEPGSITDEMLAPDGIKPQVAQLWGNQLTGELSGTIATTDDAYAAPPMALTVDGKSTQATTTGKNLFNKDNTPRGYYNNSGEFVANNTYVWWSVPVSEGDVIRYTNCVYCTMTHWYNGAYVDHSPQTWGAIFTVPSGIDEIRGYSGTSTLDTAVVTKNNADLTYEPYTGGKPTPRPDYPQPILSVDDLSLCMCGINRMYIDASTSGVTETDGSTTYEPYVGTTVPDLLPDDTSLRSLPDGTRDTLNLSYLRPSTREGWAWYSREMVQMVYATLWDGVDEGWKRNYETVFYKGLRSGRSNVGGTVAFMCDKLSGAPTTTLAAARNAPANSILGRSGYSDAVIRTAEPYAAVSDFTDWLAENPITALFALDTPVTTTLDPIELPQLPAPNATVWCDGGSAQPSYQMQYVQDTNIVIAELRAALADLATS